MSNSWIFAQLSADRIFTFLDLSPSARISALGGQLITVADGDISLLQNNPGLQHELFDNALAFQHQFFFEGIQNGSLTYARSLNDTTFVFGGIQYIDYGEFEERDILGNQIGNFKGGDILFQIGANRRLYDRLSVGATLKYVHSTLAEFTASGIALDLGVHYNVAENLWSAALVIQNLGIILGHYTDLQQGTMPLNIQLAISKQLRYLPLRFSIQAHHLNRWNLLYDLPESNENSFFVAESEPGGFDNFFRHIIFNAEFLIGKQKNFFLRFGYNHQRKQELSINNVSSLNGFSTGFGCRISKFRFDYAFRRFHYAGGTHHLGLSTRLGTF